MSISHTIVTNIAILSSATFIAACGGFELYASDTKTESKCNFTESVSYEVDNLKFRECVEYAKQGDGYASGVIGYMYENGYGIDKSLEDAIRWYTEGSKRKDARANFGLGRFYVEGIGVDKDLETGIEYLNKAASQGSGDAEYYLGNIYNSTLTGRRQISIALDYYTAAANKGIPQAMYQIAYLNEMSLALDSTIENAIYWYTKASMQDIDEDIKNKSLEKLVNIFSDGHKTHKSIKKAVELATLLAQKGDSKAQVFLGKAYYNGVDDLPNYKDAFYWFNEAAKQGEPEAQYYLGLMYYNGQGVDQNYNQSNNWFYTSANQDFAPAKVMLGHSYRLGFEMEQNTLSALEWYESAAKQGNEEGMYYAAIMLMEDLDLQKDSAPIILSYLEKAAHKGNKDAKLQLGKLYSIGSLVRKNVNLAFDYYNQAAHANSKEAMYLLSQAYENGQGVKPNKIISHKWLLKSAESGYALAQVEYAQKFILSKSKNVKELIKAYSFAYTANTCAPTIAEKPYEYLGLKITELPQEQQQIATDSAEVALRTYTCSIN